MSDPQPTPAPPSREPSSPWTEVLISYRWPLALVALALVGFSVFVVTLRRVDRAGEALGTAVERAEEVARGFLTGNITETFVASLPEIDASGSGLLELARLEATETFTRSDERRVLWDLVSLGTTATEIKVPVTYRYHLRLDDPWHIEVTGDRCLVRAPVMRPTQPPAIHTEGMEKRVDESWLRFDGADQLAMLEKTITPRLRVYAGDPRHLELARETSRRTVAEFIRSWLLAQDQWRSDRLRTIRVIFADEEVADPGEGPTIELAEE